MARLAGVVEGETSGDWDAVDQWTDGTACGASGPTIFSRAGEVHASPGCLLMHDRLLICICTYNHGECDSSVPEHEECQA